MDAQAPQNSPPKREIRRYRGGVKVTVTSRKVEPEESQVPTYVLESELYLFWLFFPLHLVLMDVSHYTQP